MGQSFRYARLYADADGESHFADVDASLEPVQFAPPAPPLNVSAIGGASRLLLVGGERAWGGDIPHPAPARQVFCVLSGTFEVTASDGTRREFPAGSMLLLEDTTGRGHATRILTEDTVTVCVVLRD